MLTFGPHLDGYHDVADQMIHHLRVRAERMLEAQQVRKGAITSVAQFKEHRARVRERYLTAIGGLPVADGEPRSELHPEIRGRLDRGSYTIEKLLYQSLPGFYVTAALYVPKGITRPGPAVLFVCGHAEMAKAYPVYQQVCADLARNGFVVLAMDPPGQGERWQYRDPENGNRIIGGCTTEHSYAGLQTMLLGASVSRWFTWDAIRAIDYLSSRPEVDPARIGVTGNSGGGTQTSLLMLAEPRLAAAMPCTFIMTLESYHATGQAQDAEQYIPGAFLHGPDHDDYLTMMAPKPVLVGAVAYDFFPIEGTLEAVRRAKRIYALFGAEDRVDLAIAQTRHEYAPALREAAVNWFRKHLAGLPPAESAEAPEIVAAEELNVTASGQVLGEFPQGKTLFDLNRELMLHRRPQMTLRSNDHPVPAGVETLRADVASVLSVPLDLRAAPIYPRIIREKVVRGYPTEKLFFFSEPGICVSGVMAHPREEQPGERQPRPTVLLLLENGTSDIPAEKERIEALLRDGNRVFTFDPRGVGGVEMRPFPGAHPHDREWRLGWDAVMMGISTLGLWVFDVLRGCDYLTRCRTDVSEVRLFGVDSGAAWAWYAAVLEPGIASLTVERMLTSYRDLIGSRYYSSERHGLRNLAYGLLERFDLPDLLAALAPRPVRIVSPVDPQGVRVDPEAYTKRHLQTQQARWAPGWAPIVE